MPLTNIKFIIKRGAKLPIAKRDKWQKDAFDYRVTLRYKGRRMSLDFWTGKGWTKAPELSDVLDCMFSDLPYADMTFDEFCNETGFDNDSRKAERSWKATRKQARKFNELLEEDCDALSAEYWKTQE